MAPEAPMTVKNPWKSHVISFPIAPHTIPAGIGSVLLAWVSDWMRSKQLTAKIRRRYVVDSFTFDRWIIMTMVRDAMKEILPVTVGAMIRAFNCFEDAESIVL